MRWSCFLFTLERIHQLDHQEYRSSDEEEVHDGLSECAIPQGNFLGFASMASLIGNLSLAQVSRTTQRADYRHDQVADERRHDFGKRATNHNTHRHIDDIAAQWRNHETLSIDSSAGPFLQESNKRLRTIARL